MWLFQLYLWLFQLWLWLLHLPLVISIISMVIVDTCGGVVELYLSDISKEISSPGYNEGRYYSEYQECTWLIKVRSNNIKGIIQSVLTAS